MYVLNWQSASELERKNVLARSSCVEDVSLLSKVETIIKEVKRRGDEAIREYTSQYDGHTPSTFRVSPEDIKASLGAISPNLYAAMQQAHTNITKFHEAEYPKSFHVEVIKGVTCSLHWRAINTVGIYVPSGTAPLFSTVLMQAIPAVIAGCARIVLCAPAREGRVHPSILAAAALCGVTEIFSIGGAQAVAALAYGTDSIPKVDKICGPGNAFVTKAKQLVSQDPEGAAIDMPAGPSEVLVIAEEGARPDWVAADMLAQAEHDPNSQALLVTTSQELGDRVNEQITQQVSKLIRRQIAEHSLKQSRIIVVPTMKVALEVSNQYAPEHLIIHHEDAASYLPFVQNAGSVFLGATTPESAGDYASGTNHVLPTYGYARAYNGINVLSFMKSMTSQVITQEGLLSLAPTIIEMAEAEGLGAHAEAVKIRIKDR